MTILGYRESPLKINLDTGEEEYDYDERSYVFQAISETPRGMISTAAILACCECGKMIKSMGGPGYRCYCTTCYDVLKLADFSQGHEHIVKE